MGGDRGIVAAIEQELHQLDVVAIDIFLMRVSDAVRLQVRAFAEADADAAAIEVRLDDHTDGLIARVEVDYEVECAVDVLAGLHVDADEAGDFGGVADELFDVVAAGFGGKIEPELRELERDVALDIGVLNGGLGADINVA